MEQSGFHLRSINISMSSQFLISLQSVKSDSHLCLSFPPPTARYKGHPFYNQFLCEMHHPQFDLAYTMTQSTRTRTCFTLPGQVGTNSQTREGQTVMLADRSRTKNLNMGRIRQPASPPAALQHVNLDCHLRMCLRSRASAHLRLSVCMRGQIDKLTLILR